VARVLQELGGDVIAIVATGGATGRVFEEMLDEARVRRRSVPVTGQTRVSLNVQDLKRGLEYRFVPQGPTLTFAEFEACLAAVDMEPGEWLIASGSLPHGVPDDAYAKVARIAARKGQRFVVDTSGAALAVALAQGGCELVKPSLGELEHLVGRELKDPAEQNKEAMALVRRGAARMVAVTLGADGALLATEVGVTAGAGDGRGNAHLGRRGRRIPGRRDPRPGVRRLSRKRSGLGDRGRRGRYCLRRHGEAAAGRCGGALPLLVFTPVGRTPSGSICRQSEMKHATAGGVGLHPQTPTMRLDDGAADG
jgi:hypothetical protein